MIEMIVFLLFVVGFIALIVWYLKSFYKQRDERQRKAEEHRKQNGGEYILIWNDKFADGQADGEFGKLVVQIPKKHGNDAVNFYEKGFIINKKRISYSNIKDIILVEATSNRKYTLKQAARDMGVLWIYQKKGSTIGIREMSYQFDNEIMGKIKSGLGF